MERDFMGLGVKQGPSEETHDAAPVRSSQMQQQWPFPKKDFSSSSSLLSFHGVQEEKPKSGFDSLARSAALKTIDEAFDSSQKNIASQNQAGVSYTMATYHTKQIDTYPFQRSMVSQPNLTSSSATTNSMHNSIIANARQNLIASASSQPLAAVPAMLSNNSFIGTDLWNASNAAGPGAQLTLFYNGSVCVYDNVAPEKAQAIMLLAGNGPSMTFTAATQPPAPIQAHIPKPNALDGFVVSQSYRTTPHHVSPAPVMKSISVSQCYNNSPTPHRSSPAPLMNSISVSQSYKNSPTPHLSSPAPLMNPISVSQSYKNNSTPHRSSPAPIMNPISVSQSYKNSPTPLLSSSASLVNSIAVSQSSRNSPTPHCSSPAPLMNLVSVTDSYKNSHTPLRSSPTPLINSITLSQSHNNSPTTHCSSPAPLMSSVSLSESRNNSSTPPCSSSAPLINSVSVSQSFNNSSTPHCSSPAPFMNSSSVSQAYNNNPTQHCSTPARVNSISVSLSVASHDTNLVKPSNVGLSSSKTNQPQRVGHSLGAAPLSADAVPQFRRRSLARFMEKRKERAAFANPYGDCSKKP